MARCDAAGKVNGGLVDTLRLEQQQPKSPADVLKNLSKEASYIAFGGGVSGRPAPPMGAGTLPPAGDAASMHDIALVGEDGGSTKLPLGVDTYKLEMNSACYSVTPVVAAKCSYGGPGGCTHQLHVPSCL
ncbi:hypothetical protein GUJ93_ZPchr0002g22990 [Zizania palustris]|uniref:Neprosin PEP catalytic domain-containing protein n=1 Tax=Zizania palustris TaxID=103762 RepID=A0A8J5VAF9_ZIZPA|nr:hypothetical protein GUJ93_ZPchr0002g22990 [Zizania palustris]